MSMLVNGLGAARPIDQPNKTGMSRFADISRPHYSTDAFPTTGSCYRGRLTRWHSLQNRPAMTVSTTERGLSTASAHFIPHKTAFLYVVVCKYKILQHTKSVLCTVMAGSPAFQHQQIRVVFRFQQFPQCV